MFRKQSLNLNQFKHKFNTCRILFVIHSLRCTEDDSSFLSTLLNLPVYSHSYICRHFIHFRIYKRVLTVFFFTALQNVCFFFCCHKIIHKCSVLANVNTFFICVFTYNIFTIFFYLKLHKYLNNLFILQPSLQVNIYSVQFYFIIFSKKFYSAISNKCLHIIFLRIIKIHIDAELKMFKILKLHVEI